MPALCLYFQVHQPYRIKRYRIFDIGNDHDYFNEGQGFNDNRQILSKVSRKSYLPTNKLLYELLNEYKNLKIAFSFSGVVLEQIARFEPMVLQSFQDLVRTGRVEILSETYYHSLSFLYSKREFVKQIYLHQQLIATLFKTRPQIFRNTELIYQNQIGKDIEALGFKGMLTEGADHILKMREPNYLYKAKGTKNLKLLLKNYRLSDDIAFRFSSKDWNEYPLTPEKYASWIHAQTADIINLFMDYETFGEHQWMESGIFDFLRMLPKALSADRSMKFFTPSEAIDTLRVKEEIDIPEYISWADVNRDLSAWRSNPMQYDALEKLYKLEKEVLRMDDPKLLEDWRRLQTSDHFYYMCTKWFADGDVHKYFNPYRSPHDAFTNYINVLHDLRMRIR